MCCCIATEIRLVDALLISHPILHSSVQVFVSRSLMHHAEEFQCSLSKLFGDVVLDPQLCCNQELIKKGVNRSLESYVHVGRGMSIGQEWAVMLVMESVWLLFFLCASNILRYFRGS